MLGRLSKFSLRKALLYFQDPHIEREFESFSFEYDRIAFRIMAVTAALVNLCVFFADWYRSGEWMGALLFRGSIAFFLFLCILISYSIKKKDFWQLQTLIFFTISGLIFSYFIGVPILPMPDFALPNSVVNVMFFALIASGLRFRYGIIYAILVLTCYVVFCLWINPNQYWSSQIIIVTINALIGIIASYLIEWFRRRLFVKNDVVARQNSELESVDELKNKLFSILSHDLRSPLKKLGAMISMFNKEYITKEELGDHTKKIEHELANTNSVLDNLLYWSKNLIGGYEPDMKEIELKSCVNSIVDTYKDNISAKNLKISNNLCDESTIVADEEMLVLCVRNLLSNAIKFTEDGGDISFQCKAYDTYAEIKVSDTGVGISRENQRELFKLQKTSSIGTHGEKGNGIGLYLLNEFLKNNGGEIYCESIEGKGSRFSIKLPIQKQLMPV